MITKIKICFISMVLANMAVAASEQCPPVDEHGKYEISDEAIAQLNACLDKQEDTQDIYFDENTHQYSPQRKQLHKEIISEFTKDKSCVEQPMILLTAGAPGAGKSTALEKYAGDSLTGYVYVGADEVQKEFPEYKNWNAADTHAEANDVVKKMLVTSTIPCTYNIVYDSTMSWYPWAQAVVGGFKDKSYKVYMLYVNVPYEVSLERAMNRYQSTGRYIPPDVIKEDVEGVEDTFQKIKSQLDGYIVVDGVTGDVIEQDNFPGQ